MTLKEQLRRLGSHLSGTSQLKRLVDDYVRRKRFDDADLKRGQKYIPDKNFKRNPIVDGDVHIEPKPIKVRYVGWRLNQAVEPSEELKDMNRKKVWGQYESKFATERLVVGC